MEAGTKESGADTLESLAVEEEQAKRHYQDKLTHFSAAKLNLENADAKLRDVQRRVRLCRNPPGKPWPIISACGIQIPVEFGARYRFIVSNPKGRLYFLEGTLVECDGHWIGLEGACTRLIAYYNGNKPVPTAESTPTEYSRIRESTLGYMPERI